MLEFKYLGLEALGLSGEEVREKGREELAELPVVRKALGEAKAQLIRYREALERKYGEILRLRTYAVVSLGFERLVWEEV